MNILTDEDIKAALDSVAPCLEDRDILYSRAIEAAIMAKFEVVAYMTTSEEGDPAMLFFDQQEARTYCDGDEPVTLYALKEK